MNLSDGVFLKVMETAKGLERSIFALYSIPSKAMIDIDKKIIKIQVELLPMVKETNDLDTSRVSKCFWNFYLSERLSLT